jgi:uncharacterized DUF497 family protein
MMLSSPFPPATRTIRVDSNAIKVVAGRWAISTAGGVIRHDVAVISGARLVLLVATNVGIICGMTFEWDEEKRESNLSKHGVDFVLAEMLFDGRPVITAPSLRAAEERYITTGKISGRFFTAVWTWRGVAVRLISLRRARDEEEKRYRALHGQGA